MAKTKSIAMLFVKPEVRVLVEDLEGCIDVAKSLRLTGLESLLHCARAALPLGADGQALCSKVALEMLRELEPMLVEWRDQSLGAGKVLH